MEGIQDLQEANRCIREMAALSLLPAIWSGGKPEQIAENLADGLQNSLRAEIVYVRSGDGSHYSAKEAVRLRNVSSSDQVTSTLIQSVKTALGRGGTDVVDLRMENCNFRVAVMSLGPSQEFGVIAVGTNRPNFPTPSERILINVSVNQAIIAFRSAKQVAALRRSESNLRDFVENAAEGLHWVNADGIIIWANQAEMKMLGYESAEYIGRNIAEFHVDARVKEDMLEPLMRGESLREFETRMRCKDGSFRHVVINSNGLFENGKFLHTRCFTRDISQRKQAEKASIEASEHRRLALEAAALGAWDYRFDTGEILWDARCRNMWGIKNGSRLDYDSVIEQLHPEDREATRKAVDAALAGVNNGNYRREFRVTWPDGSEHWIASHGQAYFEGEGDKRRPVRFIGIVREITEEKCSSEILEQTVQKRTAELKETITELEAFSYSISHDMRSPLRAMQGYAEALVEEYGNGLDEKGLYYLGKIQRGASRLDLLIQDVLAYSKVAKGTVDVKAIDLETIIKEVIENYPPLQAPHANITVAGQLPKILGHEAYLTQIVSNLLANAVKFISPGTVPTVKISSESEADKVSICFEDNGIGIDPRHHREIFQIFGRVYPDKKYEGTGIGLAIVRKATERMGGSIALFSELGKGSRFMITLKKP
jgi:PAS domain S-box-containing protein